MNLVELFDPRDARGMLFIALTAFAAFYLVALARGVIAARRGATEPGIVVGAVTNFFDTLGIGSFATTTSIYKFFRMVPDELIPGTLNVGHTMGAVTQTYIYTRLVPVESATLVSMIVAAVAGSWLGAGVVAGWPRRRIQVGMGFCLLGAATLMFMGQAGMLPAGGQLLGVSGTKLGVAVGVNFALGALMTLGIGLYAPCLMMVSLLGMNPTAAFPIMMGSCAFLTPVGSLPFVRAEKYDPSAAIGLTLGGIPAVLIAALLIRELPLDAVRWLVIFVAIFTSTGLLRSASGR